MTHPDLPIRDAAPADRAATAAMLARAFADDPAMAFIFPDRAERLERIPRLFALLFDDDAIGLRLLVGDGLAATLWRPPGKHGTTWFAMLRQAIPLLGIFGSALGRGLAVSSAMDANFPDGDYWYLHIAGCEPAMQGRGLGGAAVRAGLDRVADSGLPAYLETATPRNVSFYQSLGFEVVGEWTVGKEGPRFWSMVRAAAPGSARA